MRGPEEVLIGWVFLCKYWLSRVVKFRGTKTRGERELSLVTMESTLKIQRYIDGIILCRREAGVHGRGQAVSRRYSEKC